MHKKNAYRMANFKRKIAKQLSLRSWSVLSTVNKCAKSALSVVADSSLQHRGQQLHARDVCSGYFWPRLKPQVATDLRRTASATSQSIKAQAH